MRTLVVSSLVTAGILLSVAHGFANESEGDDDEGEARRPVTIAVFGDAPYGTTPTDTVQFNATPAFIQTVNADPAVSLVMHVGDIHSGKQYCTEAYDRGVAAMWTQFQDSVVYTPGDNEWADCHKAGEGGGTFNPTTGAIQYVTDATGHQVDYAGGDPVANLALVRSIFFAQPGRTLGGGKKHVLSQAKHYNHKFPADAQFVENVIFTEGGVLFVTINLPGGSNNDQDVWYGAPKETAAQTQERTVRTAADLRWLDTAFDMAADDDLQGVVIMAQADMWDAEKGAAHQAGYEAFVSKVADRTLALAKPVLMLNGDSHVYRSDNPLSAVEPLNAMHPGYNVPNFHRIVVHGSTLPLEYMRLTVDASVDAPNGPDAFGPFSWHRVIE